MAAQLGTFLLLPSRLRAEPKTPLKGHIVGLTTLAENKPGLEQSGLFNLNLATGHSRIKSLGDFHFGHSLERLPAIRGEQGYWLAIPYGDDASDCLVLTGDGEVIHRIQAPSDFGFGGHAVVFPGSQLAFTHLNRSGYENSNASDASGATALINTKTGSLKILAETPVLHAHDMLLSRDGRYIVVSDDGTKDLDVASTSGYQQAFSLDVIRPAYFLFDAKTYSLIREIPLPINGSPVHIVENLYGDVIAAVEQYARRNPLGFAALEKQLGNKKASEYIAQVDPEVFVNDLPFPGPLFSTQIDTGEIQSVNNVIHQDPFDICMNEQTGIVCNVFTSSNTIARQANKSADWSYHSAFNLEQPFGLCDIPGTAYMAVNGFDKGISIFDVRDMTLVSHVESLNYGLKHLQFQPESAPI